MKKFIFFSLSLCIVITGIAFSSCKSHEKCPAYTKSNTNATTTSIKSA